MENYSSISSFGANKTAFKATVRRAVIFIMADHNKKLNIRIEQLEKEIKFAEQMYISPKDNCCLFPLQNLRYVYNSIVSKNKIRIQLTRPLLANYLQIKNDRNKIPFIGKETRFLSASVEVIVRGFNLF